MCVHFPQVAPRGIAERVNLGLLPSSEGGWSTACACLRADKGGWMHVHGNVSSKPGTPPRTETNMWDEPSAAMLERVARGTGGAAEKSVGSYGDGPWLDWALYVANKMQVLLSECNGPGSRWTVVVRHLEHVKSYAPHIDHLVVDLECRPVINLER